MNREEILKAIDTLTEQAGGKIADEGTLRVQFESLTRETQALQAELAELKAMPDEYYSDSNRKLLDQQSVIQNRARIRELSKELKSKERLLDELKTKESKIYYNLLLKKSYLSVVENSVEIMKERMNVSTSDEQVKEHYDGAIQRGEKMVSNQQAECDALNKEYEEVQSELNKLVGETNTLNEEIEELQTRITKAEESLSMPDNYINKTLKDADEAKIRDLESKLAEKEAKRNEIVSNPVIIGSDAKKALLENDVTVVINKANSLSEIAKQNPYINIQDKAALEEEVKAKSEERDRTHSEYDQQDFAISNNKVNEILINYFQKRIEKLNEEKEVLTKLMVSLDKDETFGTEQEIRNITSELESLSSQISTYKEVVNNTETETEKVELQAAYENKIKQKETAENGLNMFISYQSADILTANKLSDIISDISKEINNIYKRIDEMQVEDLKVQTQGKDILSQKTAMAELKEKAKVVQDIKFAMKFDQTPDQIVEQISQSLGTDLTPVSEEKEVTEPVIETVQVGEQPKVEEAVLSQPEESELVTEAKNEDIEYQQAFATSDEIKEVSVPVENVPSEPEVPTEEEKTTIEQPIIEESSVVEPVIEEIAPVETEDNLAELFSGSKVVDTEEVKVEQQQPAQEVINVEEVKVEEQPIIPSTLTDNNHVISDTKDLQDEINNINEFFAHMQETASVDEGQKLELGV